MEASSSVPAPLSLTIYEDEVTVYQLPQKLTLPAEVMTLPWYSISRTDDETSVTVPSATGFLGYLDSNDRKTIKEESGWRVLKIEGILDFGLVGILAQVVNPLKCAQIPVFVISTYNTDYVLVKGTFLENAKEALAAAGLAIADSNKSLLL